MGDWTITVHGTGAHHNKDYAGDANRQADDFVDSLRKSGQTVHSASFTHGARQKLGTQNPVAEVKNASFLQNLAQSGVREGGGY